MLNSEQIQQFINSTVPRKQPQYYAQTAMFYGHTQSSVKFKQYGTIATSDQICSTNNTDKRRKKYKSKTKEAPQGSQTSPNVDKQQPPIGIAATHHVTTGDHSQNSPTNQSVSTENQDKCFLYWLFISIFKFKSM